MTARNSCHIRVRNRLRSPGMARLSALALAVVLVSECVWGIWSAVATAADRDDHATYYVSVGDSYPAGYRPNGTGSGSTSRDAFVYQVQDKLAQRRNGWTTVNFACSGETAYAMTFEPGCDSDALAPGGVRYPDTPQSVAAADFIVTHRDRIGLVTIVMGGNDVIGCLDRRDAADAQRCAEVAVPRVVLSVDFLLSRVRDAAGPRVPIVGVSYINVFVADRLRGDPNAQRRADFSVALFDNYLNPALAQTYSRHNASFVDTTALAGGDLPATDKSALPGHGTVTASIGRVCALSYYCSQGDPHPNREGHALIAGEIARLTGL
jgi:lysophospholipase L1-like esterase